jgi:hypothetical protein
VTGETGTKAVVCSASRRPNTAVVANFMVVMMAVVLFATNQPRVLSIRYDVVESTDGRRLISREQVSQSLLEVRVICS